MLTLTPHLQKRQVRSEPGANKLLRRLVQRLERQPRRFWEQSRGVRLLSARPGQLAHLALRLLPVHVRGGGGDQGRAAHPVL